MAHTYPNVLIHCIFSTKHRRDSIPDDLREKLSMYFVGIGKGHDIPVLCAGGTANHAHLLIALPASMPLAKAMQVVKANSSRWLSEHGFDFAWQEGYGAFSVSASNLEAVRHYIEHQAEHHAKHSFEDESFPALPCRAFTCRRRRGWSTLTACFLFDSNYLSGLLGGFANLNSPVKLNHQLRSHFRIVFSRSTQSAAARGRRNHGRPGADPRGRGQRQDARHHIPYCLPD
jgi:putative transposase